MQKEQLILKLHDIQALKFGLFTLENGTTSPIYIDLQMIISYPQLLQAIADLIWEEIREKFFELLCGIPYTSLAITTLISTAHHKPMVLHPRENGNYGMKKTIEGLFFPRQTCLLIEDVLTNGSRPLGTIQALEKDYLKITDVVAFIDREQGGKAALMKKGYSLHSILTLSEMLGTLENAGKVESNLASSVMQFVYNSQISTLRVC